MKKNDLIHGNIAKALLLFVLPLIAGSLIQQLYTTADAIIVGQFTGKNGLAAIDSVHTLFKFPINFMNGLAAGATIIISRYFGAKDKKVYIALYIPHFLLHACLTLCLFQLIFIMMPRFTVKFIFLDYGQ